LGSGEIGHSLTISALSVSENAVKKIINSGGKIISLSKLLEEYPEGRGVRIIG
jgi:large subunit ribosomal protein L18e